MTHVAWTNIQSFYNVRKLLASYPNLLSGNSNVTYKAKVKLHGTNAGVRIDFDGKVTAFSRSAVITVKNDNAGFAKWVADRESEFSAMKLLIRPEAASVVVFGEWCGPGIQKGVACNSIPNKIFAIFAARHLATDGSDVEYVNDPNQLVEFTKNVSGSYVIPWFNSGEQFDVDWSSGPETLQVVVDKVNAHVAFVEQCDPWITSQFGVRGTGEGLVFYPVSHKDYQSFSNLCFKAKGEKHQNVAKSKPVQVDPNVAADLEAFAEMVLTPARLEQGVRAVAKGEFKFESKKIGAYLAWISKDILKETTAEMEASGLDPKATVRACSDRARSWYLEALKTL